MVRMMKGSVAAWLMMAKDQWQVSKAAAALKATEDAIVHEAQVAFLKPGYIKLLARTRGPFPRRQDLRRSGLHIGELPPGRIFIFAQFEEEFGFK